MRLMPTLKLFKIGVKLNVGERNRNMGLRPMRAASGSGTLSTTQATSTGQRPVLRGSDHKAVSTPVVTEAEKKLIRILQRDLPILDNPFDQWAAEAGISVDKLLEAAEQFRARGMMRRFSAVLRHRELGFDANAMGVWVVPAEKQEAFGATAAGFQEVSHCYLRPSYPDWPYNIFTMIHTEDRAASKQVLTDIASATGIDNYTALYSTHEYKKVRVQYFTGDALAWEADVIAGESTKE